ncbi:MAG: hypothetical protein AB8H80_00185 [Planctomycetota bacterium]
MSFSEDVAKLEQSLVSTHSLLEQLHERMLQRRGAWVSVRADVLAPTAEIESLSQQLVREEQLRTGILARIRDALPTPRGAESHQLHLNITRIAAALPAHSARSLREAADRTTAMANAVRTETTLGQRLLRFAQSAQPQLAQTTGSDTSQAPTNAYDRAARNVIRNDHAGQILDGRI